MILFRAAIVIGTAILILPAPAIASTVALADLVRTDDLGFECISDADLELAFAATGKGIRLPRTCLPDPCAILSRDRLGHEIIGRPPSEAEWDEYYARYAEYCRAETTPFDGQMARPTAGQFWRPLLTDKRRVAGWLSTITGPGLLSPTGSGTIHPASPGLIFPGPSGSEPPRPGGKSLLPLPGTKPDPLFPIPSKPGLPPGPITTPDPGEPDSIAAIPLPRSLWLLAFALGAMVMASRFSGCRTRRPARNGAEDGVPARQAWP